MSRQYIITQEQLDSIEHYKRMFEVNASYINDLCSSEKEDIVYGFELGQRYTHLRECFMAMMELESEIRKQEFVEKASEIPEIIDPEEQSIKFTNNNLRAVSTLLSVDYRTGFKEGVEKYIAYLNSINS
mgnify:CR=1 FL=1